MEALEKFDKFAFFLENTICMCLTETSRVQSTGIGNYDSQNYLSNEL